MANFLAPVAGEANMGGPLGWIADSWVAGMLDVSGFYLPIHILKSRLNDSELQLVIDEIAILPTEIA